MTRDRAPRSTASTYTPRLLTSLLILFAMLGLPGLSLAAQDDQTSSPSPDATGSTAVVRIEDPSTIDALRLRPIGPFRGGRSAAVTGVVGQPRRYYFGAAGGGVWRTDDGGSTWENISDGFFGGSIGAVAVSQSDPNVLYVGGGEKTLRGNVSHGEGVWKSLDAGATWTHIGLEDTRHIPRIRIHPRDPDLVYVAALGHLFGPNEERGVFRSRDGGATWEPILTVDDEVGAFDLVMDPSNPRVLFATTWRIRRTPWSLESGGEGSGLWKTTDGGDTWNEITDALGLPEVDPVGVIGVSVSPVDPDRVWAQVESEEGGLFRSDDGGETFQRINDDRNLRQRAWYYTRVYADTADVDTVYVLNVAMWRSKDGGKSVQRISTPHSDHHDLWIDPNDPRRMVVGDDGGAQVSLDAGANWTTYLNQPTAQFYRVTTDDHFPYRIYGAQQDNSTVRIAHRNTEGVVIDEEHWEPTAGGESGHIAPDPEDPEIVYGGSYLGYLQRLDHRNRQRRAINVWPDFLPGHGAVDAEYRFQWNYPIFFSPHEPQCLYVAGNVLFQTEDEGQSFQPISPDLTRNDPEKLQSSGGSITKDNTGVEYYCTIFAACESPHEPGVLWAGTDDGRLHIRRGSDADWIEVTPPMMPEWTQVNSIEPHPTEPGGLYVAATRYKLDDFRPYLYKTTDYGRTWTEIVDGIAEDHFTRVVRADPGRPGLLYAGTESGLYISLDDGAHWTPFQQNLPIVPITDLAIKDHDLIVATQGRSFWILDDLTPLHQIDEAIVEADLHLYQPRPTYRVTSGSTDEPPRTAGQNPPAGVVFTFQVEETPTEERPVVLEILEEDGDLIRSYRSDAEKPAEQLKVEPGLNRHAWSLRYPDSEVVPGLILWPQPVPPGPVAVPGTYRARLTSGESTSETTFEIRPDPRSQATPEDYQSQFDYLIAVRDKLTETHRAIAAIRTLRGQINGLTEPLGGRDDEPAQVVHDRAKAILEDVDAIENALYQTKNRSPQDVLNFPIKLNNRLSALIMTVGSGNRRPTDQSVVVKDELVAAIDQQLDRFRTVLDSELPEFNRLYKELDLPAVKVDPDAPLGDESDD